VHNLIGIFSSLPWFASCKVAVVGLSIPYPMPVSDALGYATVGYVGFGLVAQPAEFRHEGLRSWVVRGRLGLFVKIG